MKKYNSQAFTPEEVEQGLHLDLLNYLLDYNKKCKDGYYDIHITSDSYCTIIEGTDIMGQFKDEEGKFRFVDCDEVTMKEITYPDGHYDLVYPEDAEEIMLQWHKDHPGWVKTSYGTGINEEENKKLMKDLLGADE